MACDCSISKHKTAFLTGVLTLVLLALTAVSLFQYHESIMEERQRKVRIMVDAAYAVIDHYYAKIAKEGMSEADAKKYAIQAVQGLPYDINGYSWINDMNGVMIMHPSRPDLNGQNLYEARDSNGKFFFKDFINTVQQNHAGFISYTWPKPGKPQDHYYPKLSYVEGFTPWNWVVGSGIYIDDVDGAFLRALFVTGSLILGIALFVGIFVLTLSESFKKP